jgi:hypothetical protein
MALPNEVELAKQRMQQSQDALMKYVESQEHNPELHKTLINDVRTATEKFLSLISGLRPL